MGKPSAEIPCSTVARRLLRLGGGLFCLYIAKKYTRKQQKLQEKKNNVWENWEGIRFVLYREEDKLQGQLEEEVEREDKITVL